MALPEPGRVPDRHAQQSSARGGRAEVPVRTLVDRLPAILYVADAGVDGAWHYVSAGVRDILGFEPKEWLDDAGLWARQVHPEDREEVFGREDDLIEPGTPD